jgi:outer membrane protein assembly factor BamB
VIVVDPYSGDESYRVGVVGVSQPPTVADGIMYITGQWREIIAIELATGRELWRGRSQVETNATRDLSWHDGRVGGGWSVCAPAVGRHVWTVNARGDLFGYDRGNGREVFVHPAAVPLNAVPSCPFANRLACAPEQFMIHRTPAGETLMEVNGQRVNDATGELLKN